MVKSNSRKPGVKKANPKKVRRKISKGRSTTRAQHVAESASISVLSGPMKDVIRETFLRRGF